MARKHSEIDRPRQSGSLKASRSVVVVIRQIGNKEERRDDQSRNLTGSMCRYVAFTYGNVTDKKEYRARRVKNGIQMGKVGNDLEHYRTPSVRIEAKILSTLPLRLRGLKSLTTLKPQRRRERRGSAEKSLLEMNYNVAARSLPLSVNE